MPAGFSGGLRAAGLPPDPRRLAWAPVGAIASAFLLMLGACGPSAPSGTTATSGARTASPTSEPPAASYARAQRLNPAPGPLAGSISGPIRFPADQTPPLAVYAIGTDGRGYYSVESVTNQRSYQLVGVKPGDYYVFTATRRPSYIGVSDARTNGGTRFDGAYTRAVACGLNVNCVDHGLVAVHVVSGADSGGVDPSDYYEPDPAAYPLVPGGSPPTLQLPMPPDSFTDATLAADYFAQSATGGRLVMSPSSCSTNIACVWFTGNVTGTAAVYFAGEAGSNSALQSCAFYLVSFMSAWHTLDWRCRDGSTPFPAVSSTGAVQFLFGETGCVNVRAAPSTSAKVVQCLPPGTAVTIDGGPVYAPPARTAFQVSFLDLWWHLAGRGWMVHQYLLP